MPKPRLKVATKCQPRKRARPKDVRPYATLFKALGDETRIEIVALVAHAGEPLCACDIEAHFDLSQPTISHHLKVLRKAGWLTSERNGTWIYYALDTDALEHVQTVAGVLTG